MSSPVTWYRITNLAVALGFAVAKYTIHDVKVSTLDFAGAVFTGAVLYFVGWWEKHPRLQWYFEPDWPAQGRVVISCVAKLKDYILSIYASALICVVLLIFQVPMILVSSGIHPYQEDLNIARAWGLVWVVIWTLYKKKPTILFERIVLGIIAVLWLYVSFRYVANPYMDDGIHENPLWVNVLFTIWFSLAACVFGAYAVAGN